MRFKAFKMFIIVLKRKSEGDSITSNFIKKGEKERSLSTKELQQKKRNNQNPGLGICSEFEVEHMF